MKEEEIKQYYERIEKLLNGANKETYGFVPEEIRQILKCYEDLQQRIDKAIDYIKHHYLTPSRTSLMSHECEKVLEILQGDSNE